MTWLKRESREDDRKINRRTLQIAVGVLIILIGLGGVLFTSWEYYKTDTIYRKATDQFVIVPEASGDLGNAEENMTGKGSGGIRQNPQINDTEEVREWYNLASVDMESLTQAYPDAVGWIFFENEDISYPIMYSGDNEKYLNMTYTGEQGNAGAIFLDGQNTPDFSDPHSLIYGHNVRNLSMFGRLRFYRTDPGYYDSHRYFQIFTGDRIYRYEIFAYGEVSAYSSVYDVYGAQPQNFDGLLEELKKLSGWTDDMEVQSSDAIVTLSTCTGEGGSRMIVSAVKVAEMGQDIYRWE